MAEHKTNTLSNPKSGNIILTSNICHILVLLKAFSVRFYVRDSYD